jgi:hypothetical protein
VLIYCEPAALGRLWTKLAPETLTSNMANRIRFLRSRYERIRWSTGKIDTSGGPSYSELRDQRLSKERLSDVPSDFTGPIELPWRKLRMGKGPVAHATR